MMLRAAEVLGNYRHCAYAKFLLVHGLPLSRRCTCKVQPEQYSIADQKLRHAQAVKANDRRVLAIEEFYDGSFLKGKCVLITGANRGLGLQLTKEAAAQGASIIATARRSTADLEAVPGNVKIIEGVDVADTSSVKTLLDNIADGEIDIVVNNAGYFTKDMETLEKMNFEEQIKQIDICAIGPLRVSSTLVTGGKVKAPGGHIVIITSQAGSVEWRKTQNMDEGGDYGHHMSRSACNIGGVLMAEELRGKGVFVSLLHPGFNRTEMTAKYSDIWDEEGAVEPEVGAKRVWHEISQGSLETTGRFVNCEDGKAIPW